MDTQQRISLFIADDDPAICSALRLLLEQEAGLTFVGEVAAASHAQQQATIMHPDLLLLDWELPGVTGTALLESLHTAVSAMRIIALSSRPEARPAALAAGADAFVSKGDPPDRLREAIRGLFSSRCCQ